MTECAKGRDCLCYTRHTVFIGLATIICVPLISHFVQTISSAIKNFNCFPLSNLLLNHGAKVFSHLDKRLLHPWLTWKNIWKVTERIKNFTYRSNKPELCFSYKVLRIQLSTQADERVIQDLSERFHHDIDLWTEPPSVLNGHVDLLVSPRRLDMTRRLLGRRGLRYTVVIEDVQRL